MAGCQLCHWTKSKYLNFKAELALFWNGSNLFEPKSQSFQRADRALPDEKAYINANCILFNVKPKA